MADTTPTAGPQDRADQTVQSQDVSPVEAAIAALDVRDAANKLSARGHQIGLCRSKLFTETLARPVAAAVESWTNGWRQFAGALRAGRTDEATAELQALAKTLGELQSRWKTWERARAKWFFDQAEPWNAEASRSGAFVLDWPVFDLEDDCWQRNLPWQEGGPGALPGQILECFLFQQAESTDPGGLFTELRAIYTSLRHPVATSKLVGRLRQVGRIANLALAVGATILPAPELLVRLADEVTSGEMTQDVEGLLRAMPDAVYRSQFAELSRRLAERFSPPPPGLTHYEVIAPEGVTRADMLLAGTRRRNPLFQANLIVREPCPHPQASLSRLVLNHRRRSL
jgi:hypothetical protein